LAIIILALAIIELQVGPLSAASCTTGTGTLPKSIVAWNSMSRTWRKRLKANYVMDAFERSGNGEVQEEKITLAIAASLVSSPPGLLTPRA
jgi:hypothetical protein